VQTHWFLSDGLVVSSGFAVHLQAIFLAVTIALARRLTIESGERPIHIV